MVIKPPFFAFAIGRLLSSLRKLTEVGVVRQTCSAVSFNQLMFDGIVSQFRTVLEFHLGQQSGAVFADGFD